MVSTHTNIHRHTRACDFSLKKAKQTLFSSVLRSQVSIFRSMYHFKC